ncbi:MAG TPA: hypothetical protein GXZ48_03445 [Acholeplasmataceae bacterium]|nr:hypothetical protein [Acholeplasmataceae bacterium]
MLEFIHCADIHLGSFPSRNEVRFNDFFIAFERVIDYAISKGVKLILISGDFFQMRSINPKTLDRTIKILKTAKANNIEIVAIEGNHDQAYFVDEESWLSFLHSQNYLSLLKSEIVDGKIKLDFYDGKKGNIIEKENFRIIGIDYLGGSTEKYIENLNEIILPSNKYTILMLHAAVNRLVGQNMGDIKGEVILKLKDKINYLALGHIHSRYEAYDFAYNPGALENIRLRDAHQDDKGFYHVIVDSLNNHEVNFIPANPRKTTFLKIDVSKAKTPEDVYDIVKNNDMRIDKDSILEVNLYGQASFNPYLIKTQEIEDFFNNEKKVLICEVNNYVNLLTTESSEDALDDLDFIISNLITEEIKINYPENPNPEKTTELILNINNMLSEDIDDDDIINELIKEEEL